MIKRYIAFERDSFMNRIQFILSLNLLLRLLSYKLLLSSNCLHCLKTPIDLFNSITLSNILDESTSVTQYNFRNKKSSNIEKYIKQCKLNIKYFKN